MWLEPILVLDTEGVYIYIVRVILTVTTINAIVCTVDVHMPRWHMEFKFRNNSSKKRNVFID